MLPAVDHHAELRAPIADVIIADDFVAEEGGNAGERVAEHGAANVADVHRLGDIRGAEIDDDAVRLVRALHTQALIAQEVGGPFRDSFGRSVKFMNPAPAIVGGSHRSDRSYASNIFWASARGFSPSCFASISAALLW